MYAVCHNAMNNIYTQRERERKKVKCGEQENGQKKNGLRDMFDKIVPCVEVY